MNFYDKVTGELLMIIYPSGDKAIITDYYKKEGMMVPSVILLRGGQGEITEDFLQNLIFSKADDNWFLIPEGGHFNPPDIFKTGVFKYIIGYDGAEIMRTLDIQTETGSGGKQEYKIRWDNGYQYTLKSLKPGDENFYIKTQITSWTGNKFYCQFLTSNGVGGTCAFEKTK